MIRFDFKPEDKQLKEFAYPIDCKDFEYDENYIDEVPFEMEVSNGS